ERVDVDGQGVVAVPPVAIERVDADAFGHAVVEPAARVEVLVVVRHTHLAGFRHRSPVDGRVHRQRQRRHVLPGWVVHHPVDDDGRRDASNGQRGVARGFGRSPSGLRLRGKRRGETWTHDSDSTDRLRHPDVPEVTKWSRCLVRSGARCDTGPRVSAPRHNTGRSAAAPVVGYRVFLAIVVTAYFTLIALTPRTEMMPEVD